MRAFACYLSSNTAPEISWIDDQNLQVFAPLDVVQIDDTSVWTDTWRFRFETTSRVRGVVVGTQDDTTWYAPGVGLVRQDSEVIDLTSSTRTETRLRLFDLISRP